MPALSVADCRGCSIHPRRGIVGTFAGGALAVAIMGGLYTGIRYLGNRDTNAKERVATWTDLLVFVAMVSYVLALVR